MNIFKSPKFFALALGALLVGSLPACTDRDAGDKLDEAGRDTGRALEDAVD